MTEDITGSFSQFNYLLRPSKQVERKLMIEILHRLMEAQYPITSYTYLGFGSPYYADFILFHKYLYIDQMICVEHKSIPKRMKFNKPYEFIQLEMLSLSAVLAKLDRSQKYLAWLDYDYALDDTMLQDIGLLLNLLSPGSVFVVTVKAQPRDLEASDPSSSPSAEKRTATILNEFREMFESLHSGEFKKSILTRKGLPRFFAEVLRAHIEAELGRRTDDTPVRYFQLFNYRYADGAQMLTIGGVVDTEAGYKKLEGSGVLEHEFIRSAVEPMEISVPPLTVAEKQWLDQNLKDALTVDKLAFELEEEPFENYRKFYRQYPTYYETLV